MNVGRNKGNFFQSEGDEINSFHVIRIKKRIQSILDVLRNFKIFRRESCSRLEYINQLCEDLSTFYGYNKELIQIFLNIFSPDEAHAFIEANENERPLMVRTNTLITSRKLLIKSLKKRGVNLDPIGDWSSIGLKIYNSQHPVSAIPEHLAGHYFLQSPSSLLPVMALNPKPGDKVLDMCAAPGGKMSHIAQLMKNQGLLIANDVSKSRLSAIISNIHRLGINNCIVLNMDAIKLPKHYGGFNKILLDAPCTGLGIISRDETIKQKRNEEDIYKLSQLQKQLILAAIDMLESKTGESTLVYSTCSISIQENEEVIAFALKKRFVRIEDTGLTFGIPGFKRFRKQIFSPLMIKTRRYYPHVHNMDGFFVTKLIKYKSGSRSNFSAIKKI